jgi:hypothetical protein
MFRSFYLRLLLALAFVLGQSFALAHATQHELDSAGKTLSCEICAVAHAGGGLPGSAPLLPTLVPCSPAPDTRLPAAPSGCYVIRPLSRGPPSDLS